jgi:hypothetical protein
MSRKWHPSSSQWCSMGRRAQSKRRGPLVPSLIESRCHTIWSGRNISIRAASSRLRPCDVWKATGSLQATAPHSDTDELPARRAGQSSLHRPCQPLRRQMGTAALLIRSIICAASSGLVWKRTLSGIWAPRLRSASSHQSRGRYSSRSMRACPRVVT